MSIETSNKIPKNRTKVLIIEKEHKRTRHSVVPKGSQPPYDTQNPTKIRRIDNVKQYFVEHDSLNLTSGGAISREIYNEIKGKYDICMVMWRGGELGLSEKVFSISGKRRDVVRDVASEHTKKFYQMANYFQVIARNKGDVRTGNICDKAKEENASILYLRADTVIASDEGY